MPLRGPCLLLALASTLVLPAMASAQPQKSKDPVEQFRQALLLEKNKPSIDYKSVLGRVALKNAIQFRDKNLKEKAAKITLTSDLSRALLLLEWPDVDPDLPPTNAFDRASQVIEIKLRKELADRLAARVRATFARGSVTAQGATATIVGETAIAVNDQIASRFQKKTRPGEDLLYLEKVIAGLAPDLAKLALATTNDRVRVATATALGEFFNNAKVSGPALRGLLNSRYPLATRKAAALALATLAEYCSGTENIRGSEPGVSAPETRRNKRALASGLILEIIAHTIPASALGMSDASPDVRRPSVAALRESATALSKISSDMAKQIANIFPPVERPWTKQERKRIDDARKEIDRDKRELEPVLKAMRATGPALILAARDCDTRVRLETRRTMEEIARARQQLDELDKTIPTKPADKNEADDPEKKDEDKVGRLNQQSPDKALVRTSNKVAVAFQEKKDKDKKPAGAMPDHLGELFTKVADSLVNSGFRDPNPAARRASMDALEALGGIAARYTTALIKSLEDRDLFVRWIAARILGKVAPADATNVVPALAKLLNDCDVDVRGAAARALGSYGAKAGSAAPALSAAVVKGDAEFRIIAMKAIESIGTPAASTLPALAKGFKDIDPRVRTEAARVMGKFGTLAKGYLQALEDMTSDPDIEVRKAASAAILEIEGD